MSNLTRFGIVAALAVAAGAVMISKRSPNSTGPTPSGVMADALSTGVAATQEAVQTATPAAMPRLVDLGAGKCIPCKMMAPILEELKRELAGKLRVEFIDVWVNPAAGETYGINRIPTQIFYDVSGKELSRHEGFMAREDILARFKDHGIDLTKAP